MSPLEVSKILRESAHRTYWSMINSGRCPHCSERIEATEKRGCCTHATPCGHKLWQGERR